MAALYCPPPPSLQGALGAALGAVVAGLVLTGGQAKALTVVNVDGLNYEVTTFTGSYNENASKFETVANGGVMPWWGGDFSSTSADEFAKAVGQSLSVQQFGTVGPLFAYASGPASVDSFACIGLSCTFNIALGFNNSRTDSEITWASISPALGSGGEGVANVPGPLPILGLAAAFGFSRQLRKRIKSSTTTAPSSTAS